MTQIKTFDMTGVVRLKSNPHKRNRNRNRDKRGGNRPTFFVGEIGKEKEKKGKEKERTIAQEWQIC